MKLHWLFNRYMAPAGDDDSGGGGSAVIDRGDDFTPTGPDAPKPAEPRVTKDDLSKLPRTRTEAPAPEDEKDIDPDNPDADEDETKDETKDDKKPRKDTRIPLARHKEILAKERAAREALERQLSQTKQADAIASSNEKIAAAETELLGMEKQYAKLVSDGDHEKAAELMAKIRTTERGINQARTTFELQAAEARAYERVQYDNTVERLEAAYPELNEDHDDFDADLMAEVVELRDAYVLTGKYTRAQAIKKAAETMMGVKTSKQAAAVKTDARVTQAEVDAAKKEDAAKATKEARAAAQRAKNGKVAEQQPPSLKSVGVDHDKMGGVVTAEAVMKMSQEEFAKLSDADLARMRGDDF